MVRREAFVTGRSVGVVTKGGAGGGGERKEAEKNRTRKGRTELGGSAAPPTPSIKYTGHLEGRMNFGRLLRPRDDSNVTRNSRSMMSRGPGPIMSSVSFIAFGYTSGDPNDGSRQTEILNHRLGCTETCM
jgi:hypothetical protein